MEISRIIIAIICGCLLLAVPPFCLYKAIKEDKKRERLLNEWKK